jgi:ribonuclease HI
VIDGHECPLRDISAGLPQGSPASPILFIVYVHALLKRTEDEHPQSQNLSFVDDIGILAKGHSIKEVSQQLEKAGVSLVQRGEEHKISFDEDKTEAIIFTRKRKLSKEVQQAKIRLPNFTCSYNKDATRWLGFWLDPKLSFREHFTIRYQKAEKVLRALSALSRKNGLPMSLVHKIQVAAVHSVALYGSEIWWEGQKDKQEKIQKLLNKQARAITGMFKTTPIPILQREANLPDATGLLDARRLGFTLRCLGQKEGHPSRSTLPPSLRFGEIGELGELFSETNLEWATKTKGGNIGKRLARYLNRIIPITLENGIDYYYEWQKSGEFPGTIKVLEREQAKQVAKFNESTAVFTDGSRTGRMGSEKTGAAIAQKSEGVWRVKEWYLGYGKTALDAELFALSQALKMALKQQQPSVVFTDSQSALELVKQGQNLPSIIREIWEDAERLKMRETPITLLWVPGHEGVEGNEEADQGAKKATKGGKNADPTVSILYLREWATRQKAKQKHPFFQALRNAKKVLTSRFLQLKCGHAAIGSYMKRFKLSDSAKCTWCGNENENTTHDLLRCKKWTKQRKILINSAKRMGVFLSPRLNEKDAQKLFQKETAEAMLNFLSETQIGVRRKIDDEEWLDTWDLEQLDPRKEDEEQTSVTSPNSSLIQQ